MDPFEAHVNFVSLLKKLDASQPSIQKVIGYAFKYCSRCGEDFWDCIIQECRTSSLNSRINLLYFLDSLCEASIQTLSSTNPQGSSSSSTAYPGLFYVRLLERDLDTIIDHAVPESREGLMNAQSTMQMLENWKTKRILDPKKVEGVISLLQERKQSIQALPVKTSTSNTRASQERGQVVKRIEQDRERHKLLRERRWVQRIDRFAPLQPPLSTFLPSSLPRSIISKSIPPTPSDAIDPSNPSQSTSMEVASTAMDTEKGQETPQLAIDIEFENAWETTSDYNEDDVDAIAEEYSLCFPGSPPKKPAL